MRLIQELRAEKRLSAVLVRHALVARGQLAVLERPSQPGGRVLLLDAPASPGDRCEGETLVYADMPVDLFTARVPVGAMHRRFDEVVNAVLCNAPRRFRSLPGELSIRRLSLSRYPRDFSREVAALVNAKLAGSVLAALNEIKDGLDEKKTAQPQDAVASQKTTQPSGAVKTEEQVASETGAETPDSTPVVPW